ncbi:MAG: winged helix-turn-helix transcriptional regulator [Deltaproteobacteria bacterium]|nr:winged helix-turn-helix transcriptional regulator [Deltaproteobacteria bacterium]
MDDFILALKALGDVTRFRIIHLLLSHDLCVGALADHLSLSKAAVSQHLQVLRKAGLVKGEKRGYWTHYGVDKNVIHRIAEALIETADQAPEFRVACQRTIEEENKTNDLERRMLPMCQNCCQQPVQLKDKPENCTPEQVRKCHGDEEEHPCTKEDRTHIDE